MGGKYRITGAAYPRMSRPRRRRKVVLALLGSVLALALLGYGALQLIDVFRGDGGKRNAAAGKDCPTASATPAKAAKAGNTGPGAAPSAPPRSHSPSPARSRSTSTTRPRAPGSPRRSATSWRNAASSSARSATLPRLRQEGPRRRDTARLPADGQGGVLRPRRPAHRGHHPDRHPRGHGHRPDPGRRLQGTHPEGGRGQGTGRPGQPGPRNRPEVLRRADRTHRPPARPTRPARIPPCAVYSAEPYMRSPASPRPGTM